jgi:hypothetical protein
MTITTDHCALCFFPLDLDRYEVLDIDGISCVCERCFRLAKQDGDLADAIGQRLTIQADDVARIVQHELDQETAGMS